MAAPFGNHKSSQKHHKSACDKNIAKLTLCLLQRIQPLNCNRQGGLKFNMSAKNASATLHGAHLARRTKKAKGRQPCRCVFGTHRERKELTHTHTPHLTKPSRTSQLQRYFCQRKILSVQLVSLVRAMHTWQWKAVQATDLKPAASADKHAIHPACIRDSTRFT